MSTNPLCTTSRVVIKAIAYTRIAVGGGTLLAPSFACDLFGVTMIPESRVLGRLFGVRDMILGAYLLSSCWNVESSSSSDVPPEQKPLSGAAVPDKQYWLKRELQRAIWIGMICDAVDVCSVAASVMDGTLAGKGVWWLGGGAVQLVVLGLIGLNRMK